MVSKGGLVDFDNFLAVVCPLGSFVSKLSLSYPDRTPPAPYKSPFFVSRAKSVILAFTALKEAVVPNLLLRKRLGTTGIGYDMASSEI